MDWRAGDLCVAKSSRFDGLYNGKILVMPPSSCSKAMTLVQFIEYGMMTEEVPIADLKPFGQFTINKAGDLVKTEQRNADVDWPGGWKDGDACMAWWLEKAWKNAKILKIFSPEEALVFFADIGSAEFTSLKKLKEIGSAGAGDVPPEDMESSDIQLNPKSDSLNLSLNMQQATFKKVGFGGGGSATFSVGGDSVQDQGFASPTKPVTVLRGSTAFGSTPGFGGSAIFGATSTPGFGGSAVFGAADGSTFGSSVSAAQAMDCAPTFGSVSQQTKATFGGFE